MEVNSQPQGRVRRAVDDLIIAEMFLVQATIESATAIGDGLSALGRHITTADDIGNTLQRIAGDAVEPYTSRFKYLRDLISARS